MPKQCTILLMSYEENYHCCYKQTELLFAMFSTSSSGSYGTRRVSNYGIICIRSLSLFLAAAKTIPLQMMKIPAVSEM